MRDQEPWRPARAKSGKIHLVDRGRTQTLCGIKALMFSGYDAEGQKCYLPNIDLAAWSAVDRSPTCVWCKEQSGPFGQRTTQSGPNPIRIPVATGWPS